MTYHTAIIGGTMRLAGSVGEAVAEEELVTPFGRASYATTYPGDSAVFVNRHGVRGEILAHRVNYRANMNFLKRCGVREVLAVFAVGGIDRTLGDGDFAVPHDLIDYTWGREHTFAPEEGVRHIEFGEPFDASVRARILTSGGKGWSRRCGMGACMASRKALGWRPRPRLIAWSGMVARWWG